MVEPDVHVAGHGGSADVEPILVIGGKLLPRKTRLLKSKKEQSLKNNLLLVFTRSTHSGTFILPDLVMLQSVNWSRVVQKKMEGPTH